MSEKENSTEANDDFDESALAALASPSMVPSAPDAAEPDASDEDESDDDDSVLDLRALAASMAPPAPQSDAPVESGAAAVAASAVADKASTTTKATASTKSVETKAAPVEPKPVVAAPVAAEPQSGGSGKWLALVAVAAMVLAGVYFITQGDGDSEGQLASADAPATNTGSESAPGANTETSNTSDTEEEGAIGESATVEPAEAEAAEGNADEPSFEIPAETDRGARPTPGRERPVRGTEAAMDAPAETTMEAETPEVTMAEPEPTMEEPAQTSMGLDSLLDNALGGRPTAGGTMTEPTMEPTMEAPPPSADLPATPSRANVSRTLGRLLPGIRQCAGEQVGMANAAIIVNRDGSVGSVNISGSPFGGTPQGACMEGVIRRARFEQFSQSTFRVTYPFAIRARN